MIADALKLLAEMATKAASPVPLPVDDPRKKRFVVNGSVLEIDLDPRPREHKVGSLDEIVRLADRFAATNDGDTIHPAVWYGRDKVILVMDDDGHRNNTATLPLQLSQPFLTLAGLDRNKTKLEQKPFIRLLRIDLAGTLDPVMLLNRVRKVRFENGSVTQAEKTAHRESMGRQITAAVSTSEGDIPEDVTLLVPVFSTVDVCDPLPIRCSVEVDPAEGSFRLLPLPDELERVQQTAVAIIGDRLKEGLPSSVPAYFGQP